MTGARLAMAAALWAAFALTAQGQTGPVLQMDFSNPGLTPSNWTLVLHPDGSGHFTSKRGNAPSESLQTPESPKLEAPDQDRDVHLTAQFAERVFQTARTQNFFSKDCDSHLKVAFQGWKKLSYDGPEGRGSCQFNYSNNKEIQTLGDSLVSVAATIIEGARIERLLLYDRLGLDREMEYMVQAQTDGHVQQICAIRSILERLAEDPSVMERVRKRAKALLAKAEE